MNEHQAVLFLSGILFAQLFTKFLKNIIKQARPISQFGLMEISRQRIGQSIYETFFKKCECCNGNGLRKTKSIIIILGVISLSMKYIIKEHTIYQLLFGILLGVLLSYIFSIISKKFDK